MKEIIDLLKKYTDGKKNTEKVEVSVLNLNRIIKAFERADLEGYSSRLWKAAYERGKADAEQRWIPVSERLPEDDGYYLATFQRNLLTRTEQYTSISEFREGSWTEYGHIIAWMPLPNVYRDGE